MSIHGMFADKVLGRNSAVFACSDCLSLLWSEALEKVMALELESCNEMTRCIWCGEECDWETEGAWSTLPGYVLI